MAQKRVVERRCDRCPIGKEKPANESVTLPVKGGDRYRLDLCEDHAAEWDRVLMSWARLGELLESDEKFGPAYRQDAQRLSTLRAAQAQTEAVRTPERPHKAMHLTGDALIGLPAEAGDWVFTDHAVQRMRERKVSAVHAMKAACEPDRRWEGKAAGTAVHVYGDTKVVVNDVDQVILTVAKVARDELGRVAQ